jgi:hypothetical protein
MKTKTMKFVMMMTMPAAVLAFTSCSSEPKTEATYSSVEQSPALSETGRGAIMVDTEKSTFTIESINPSDRTVKLRKSDGSLEKFECGPEVRNFEQLKVGDEVTATVSESLAVRLVKGDDALVSAGTSTEVVRAPSGEKPGGKVVDTVSFTAKIVSLDASTRHVTLETSGGEKETVKVGPDVDLANVKPGDHVGVRATRAFAIAVKTPEK